MLADTGVTTHVLAAEGVTVNFNGCTVSGTVLGKLALNGGTLVTAEGYKMAGPDADYYITTDAVLIMDAAMNITVESGTLTLAKSWWTGEGQTLTIGSESTFVIPAGMNLNVLSTVIIEGTVDLHGTVNLYSKNATVKASTGLTGITTTAGDMVWYTDGKYTVHSHNHVAGEYVEPTFEADGYTPYTCVCGDNYNMINEGTQLTAVAQIGDKKYTTLAAAIEAAKDGDTIVLLAAITGEVEISQAVTINKNGYEITVKAGDGYKVTEAEDTVRIEKAVVLTGSIRLRSAALNLKDKVSVVYMASDDLVATNDEHVLERGVLLFDTAEKAASKDPSQAFETVILEWSESDKRYVGNTEGIDARDMDKSQFAVAYVKLIDGTYIFGTREGVDHSVEYSPLIYCQNKKNDPLVGNLCRALMHYGAAAQVEQYKMTTGLMNEGFEAIAYDERVLGETVFAVDTSIVNGMKIRSAQLDLKGAISYIINFSVEDQSIAGKQLYAEYTLLGETKSVELGASLVSGQLSATISGIPAKDMGATLRVKPYYPDENGEKVYGGELVYSGYEYIRRAVDNKSYTQEVKDLAKALAMYIYYADVYGN